MKKYKVIYEGYDFNENVFRREKFFPSKIEAINFARRMQDNGHGANVYEIEEKVTRIYWEY